MSIIAAKLQYGPWNRWLRETFLFDDEDCEVSDIESLLTVYANPSHPFYQQGACITLYFGDEENDE